MDFHRSTLIFIDFHEFRSMDAYGLEAQAAALIETFARFQAGFLSSEDFHRFLYRFQLILIDFHRFLLIFMYFEVWVPNRHKSQPAAPIETFARFQAGFLSSEDFHGFPTISIGFHRFSWIFIGLH